jgi:peptidoglycan/LPS O-acetylase OafA/YrhL
MLRGEVRDAGDGCDFSAAFVLHPFARIWPPLVVLIFLGMAVTVWFQSHDLQGRLFAAFFLLFAGFIGFALFSGRGREREEIQITQFVENLFRDLRTRV